MPGRRAVRRWGPLVVLALLALLALPTAAPAVTLSGPGPFQGLEKGDAWFFNRGSIRCWSGTSPPAGCPQNTATLKLEGREYFVFGSTKDRIETPNLGYVRFQAPDPLQPCDLKKGGCYGNAIHCSAVRYQLVVDGNVVVTTGSLGPGTTSGVLALPRRAIRRGAHTIRVRMLGNPSGCPGNEDAQGVGPGGWLVRTWGVALWLWTAAPEADLEGLVVDEDGVPQGGVEVLARRSAPAKTYRRRTNAAGAYAFSLPAGTYTVAPTSVPGGPAFQPASRRVQLSSDLAGIDFVRRHDELELRTSSTAFFEGVDWTRLEATGAAVEAGFARLENLRGEPRTGQLVRVDPPYWDGRFGLPGPRLVMCDAGRRRVYPGDGFERFTDGAGRVDFTVYFGGEPGNWLMSARESADVRAFDVLRVAQLGAPTGPDKGIIDTLQQSSKLGIKAPLAAGSLPALQAGLLEWLLVYGRDGIIAALPRAGAFAPIRNAAGSQGGILFYPAGDPEAVRAHLERGAPLPAPSTFVIPFKRVVLPYPSLTKPLKTIWYADFGGTPWTDPTQGPPGGRDVPTLAQWEGDNGPARLGYAPAQPGEELAWLGAPAPPPATQPAQRALFERCAPGASPKTAQLEVRSPLRLRLADAEGRDFGFDARGKFVNVLGGLLVKGAGSRPDRYVVPAGAYTVTLTGTANGRATIVARRGGSASVFDFRVRRRARGTLRLRAAGVPSSLRFAGRTVRARRGIALSLRGLPRRLRAKRYATLRLRVADRFGAALANATVKLSGAGVRASAMTDARGRATVRIRPTKAGSLRASASAPGYATARRTARVRR